MSTSPEDTCPFCLRFSGFATSRAAAVRFCPACGGDWESVVGTPPKARSFHAGAVVLPVPLEAVSQRADLTDRQTGPVPALSQPGVRKLASELKLTPPRVDVETAPDVTSETSGGSIDGGPVDAPWPSEQEANLGLTPEMTDPAPPPTAPAGSPWPLVVGAGLALSLIVVLLASSLLDEPEDTPIPRPAVALTPTVAPPPSQPAAPTLPPLPTPRTSPERKSAAVKEHIELALRDLPSAVQAEIGVRVDDGVAFLVGTVDSKSTLDLVMGAAGQAFGIRAVDSRAVKIQPKEAPVHLVLPGETLSAVARRYYGNEAQWRRIYELNPGIDPNLIRVGQPLVVPTEP